ncbi:MAG TPA: queuosine precursor transporter [Candidatus Saccharimonadales bacterium]|nr:queuosine precursor transporter [Candidatus Saccharimonadales bacterium]
MTNELIFALHVGTISLSTLLFCRLGKEALIAYVSLLFVIANIFVIKQINLFGWSVTSADAFIVGISFSINVLQEFWGQAYARKAIWISFACSLFYLITTLFILGYTPSAADDSHAHFANIMTFTMRIISASFTSYLITQFTDMHIYGYIKKQTHGKYFVVRNYFALLSSQLLDTVLFSYLGLYGIVENISHIITMSYSIKIIAIFMTTPFLMIAKKVVHPMENN